MKKILRLIFSLLLLFCSLSTFVGCGTGWKEFCQDNWLYLQQETLEIEDTEDGRSFIDYNGNRYFYKWEIETDKYPEKYGLYGDEKHLVGKIYNFIYPVSPVYVSDLDKDVNVLYVQKSSIWSFGGCFLKEGVVLPDIYTTPIDIIIISLGDTDRADGLQGFMNERLCVPTLTPNTTYYDIVDQSSRAQIDTKRFEVVFHGYLGIKGFEYLKVQYLAIFEVENEICIAESRASLVDVIDYYKVKSEYQEVFRNAMNELDKTIENKKIGRFYLAYHAKDGNLYWGYIGEPSITKEPIGEYDGGLTLHEVVEENASMLEGQFIGNCYLVLESNVQIKVGQISVFEEENQLYFCIGENRKKTEEGYLCYKIKDEYQDLFRNAINELKKTCNEL